jgi:hypothetical protein
MYSILNKKSRLIAISGVVVALLAIVAFLVQPGLSPGGTSVNGIIAANTLPATNISPTSATLNGSAPLIGINTTGHKVFANGFDCGNFVWGTTPGGPYPNQTPPQFLSSGYFSAVINNLDPFTTYYYKASVFDCSVQTNDHVVFADEAIFYGNEVSFTTLGNPAGLSSLLTGDSSPTGGTPSNIIVNGNGGSQVTQVNQPVTVYARVINSGDMEGGFTVNLKVNGYVEQTKMGVVPGHEAVPVEFTIVKDVPGTYDIDIEGNTTTLTVLSAEQSSNSPSQSQYIFIAGIGLIVILIAFTTVLIMRRRTG